MYFAWRSTTASTSARLAMRSGPGSERSTAAGTDSASAPPSKRRYVARVTSMERRWSNSILAFAIPAAPMRSRRFRSSASVAIRIGEAIDVTRLHEQPVPSSSTTCRHPRTSVATIGRPIAAASIAERGKPSPMRREHIEIHSPIEAHEVGAAPQEGDSRLGGEGAVGRSERVGLVGIVGADDGEPHACSVVQQLSRTEHLGIPLLSTSLPARPTTTSSRSRPPSSTRAGCCIIVVDSRGVEPLQVDAVTEEHELVRGDVQASEHRQIFGVLYELSVRTGGSDTLERVEDAALQTQGRPAWRTGRARCSRSQVRRRSASRSARTAQAWDCGCERWRDEDDGRQDELAERSSILDRCHRPGRVLQLDVLDAASLDRRNVRPGRRSADDLVTRERRPRAADRATARG